MSPSDPHPSIAPLRKMRLTAVRIALALTAVCAAAGYAISPEAAHGLLMGGIGGVLGFWIIARRLEKLATIRPQKVHFAALTWTFQRFVLYGVVLGVAYTLDRDSYHGLIGAFAGLLLMRFVLLFIGITGIDLPKPEPRDTENETMAD